LLRKAVAVVGGCDFGINIDRRRGQQQLSRTVLSAGMTRMTTTIAKAVMAGGCVVDMRR
jgi:hypothetical protein